MAGEYLDSTEVVEKRVCGLRSFSAPRRSLGQSGRVERRDQTLIASERQRNMKQPVLEARLIHALLTHAPSHD